MVSTSFSSSSHLGEQSLSQKAIERKILEEGFFVDSLSKYQFCNIKVRIVADATHAMKPKDVRFTILLGDCRLRDKFKSIERRY